MGSGPRMIYNKSYLGHPCVRHTYILVLSTALERQCHLVRQPLEVAEPMMGQGGAGECMEYLVDMFGNNGIPAFR